MLGLAAGGDHAFSDAFAFNGRGGEGRVLLPHLETRTAQAAALQCNSILSALHSRCVLVVEAIEYRLASTGSRP